MDAPLFRPLAHCDPLRPEGAVALAGGWAWFTHAECAGRAVPVAELPEGLRAALAAPRPAVAGLTLDRPRIMGIVNVTPDSFSDGGRLADAAAAVAHGRALVAAGADLLDIGGESTRPGAAEVPAEVEIGRVVPVIAGLRAAGVAVPISVDTRKAAVARAALDAGAAIVNDVSALAHDPAMAGVVAAAGVPLVLMHMRATPATMNDAACYTDVVAEVMAELAARVAVAEAAGIPRARLIADPGIGFAKNAAHNLVLLHGVAALHRLGLPLMVGASRKRFVGSVGGAGEPAARMPGSVAVALAALAQGVQILRVHDVAETAQAVRLWWAVTRGAVAEA